MLCRSIGCLIFMFLAAPLATAYSDPDSTKEWSATQSVGEVKQKAAEDLGALLDAGDGATVTLVAGDTRLVAHRAVLAARSPVLANMLRHYTVEASGGQLIVPDVEGPVLRRLLAYLYTLRAPQLPGFALQLLAAAQSYDLPALRADCERQVASQLSVETAAELAVLAVKHSNNYLSDAAVSFIRKHFLQVLATRGWSDAVLNHPREVIQVSHLLASRAAATSAPPTTEAAATPITRRYKGLTGHRWTGPATAAATTTKRTATTEGATVSRQPKLSGDEKGRRLIEAAEVGAIDELQRLLEAGADVGARDDGGSSALHWAAFTGRVDVASHLLEAGADVNATDRWRNSPLHVAAWNGHAPLVRLLAAAGADLNARDKGGRTPLYLAVLRAHAEMVAALLEAGAEREATDNKGYTPLDIARHNNTQQLIDMLSIPDTTEAGSTATTQLHSDTTTAATPNDTCPTTPLDEATIFSMKIFPEEEKNKRLREAAADGRVATLRYLLAAGADPNAKDESERTALYLASKGPAEVVSCLLEAGASVDIQDSFRNTPLHSAARYGLASVVRLMAAATSDINGKDRWTYTPLHWAAWEGHADATDVLLEAGADKRAKGWLGSTPREVAINRGHQHLVARLT